MNVTSPFATTKSRSRLKPRQRRWRRAKTQGVLIASIICGVTLLLRLHSRLTEPTGEIFGVNHPRFLQRYDLNGIGWESVPGNADPSRGLPRTVNHYEPKNGVDEMKSRMVSVEDVYKYYFDNPSSVHYMNQDKPIVFVITPTYHRPTQLVDLLRIQQSMQTDVLGGMLQNVATTDSGTSQRRSSKGMIYWIVVEDNPTCTKSIRRLLERASATIPFAHIAHPSPPGFGRPKRGRSQRNQGLEVVDNGIVVRPYNHSGVVFLADDDNGYDAGIFDELRKVKRVGTLPVAFVGGSKHERCHVDEQTGKVDALYGLSYHTRSYPLDMAAFAFHTDLFKEKHRVRFYDEWKGGHDETKLLELLIDDISELEPLANNCTVIYTYHIKSTIGRHSKALPADPLDEEINKGI